MKLRIVAALCVLLCLSGCSLERDFSGIWYDEEDSFTVYVSQDAIVDNIFGVPMEYTVKNRQVQYTSMSGGIVSSELAFDGNDCVCVYMGDKVRVLHRRLGSDAIVSTLSSGSVPEGNGRIYFKKSAVGPEKLYMYDNSVFEMSVDGRNAAGVYAVGYDERNVLLYYTTVDGNVAVDLLWATPETNRLYGFAMQCDGPLVATERKANLASSEILGYFLEGTVTYEDTAVSYAFSSSGKCIVCSNNADTVVYNYSIGADGLITLSDQDGVLGSYDYLYYNPDCNEVYRAVLESSSWDAFLQALIEQDCKPELDRELTYNVTVAPPSLLSAMLSELYCRNSQYLWGDLGLSDVKHTNTSCSKIEEELNRIYRDDMARREYEQSLMSEREKFLSQMRAREEAEKRVLAEMYAKAQAMIAENQASSVGQGSTGILHDGSGYAVGFGSDNSSTANSVQSSADVAGMQP